ncbi:ArnT family glycosyltransferase [Devosia sp.]|jgi:4-amino-4-deoxy-L-arabinose transferase-like glycosyltransferase|uniref:ArnT family glycosyltransferase n=1 Tax=Devosia sp. TaxID=1871048 RepID=UPI0037BE43F0
MTRSIRIMQGVVAVLIVLKLWFDIATPPMGDESYYWMWGQRLELSYFDHPPLHAWLLWLTEKLVGWHWWSVRALTWFCLGTTLAVFWSWARRIMPENPQDYFWRTTTLYLATPIFWLMSTIAFNDYLLIAMAIVSAHFFLVFLTEWEAGIRRHIPLYLAALFLGLAVLTKYNGALLGLAFAAMVLSSRATWPLLRNPHLYAAGLLSVAMQAPVLWWNLTEGMASFNFHLGTRLTGSTASLAYGYPLVYLANMALVLSPFLFIALFRYPFGPKPTGFEANGRRFAFAGFGVSTLVFLAVSFFVYVFFYWNIIGYIALIPVAFRYLGKRWLFWLHTAFGLAMAIILTANFTLYPLANLVGPKDWGTSANFGWDELAVAVSQEQAAHPDAFLGATRYTYAAQIGYKLRTSDVTSFNTLTDQYDFWTDRQALAGRDALIIADGAWPIGFAQTQFANMTLLRTVTISRFDQPVTDYEIWLGESYRPTE